VPALDRAARDTISNRSVGGYAGARQVTARQEPAVPAKPRASYYGCPMPTARPTSCAAAAAKGDLAATTPSLARAAAIAHATTMAMPVTSSDCERTAQRAE
jgi:hypothetical protein